MDLSCDASSPVPDLGPPPRRLTIDAGLAAVLVAEQFPHWADLAVRPVPRGGWGNWTFRLGEDLLLRLPSAEQYALAVDKEHRWLPVMAEALPVPVTTPVARGVPTDAYPFGWSVYGWIDGGTVTPAAVADPLHLGEDLARALVALRAIDASEGPRPGLHNWFRGATLRTFDHWVREAPRELRDEVDVGLAAHVWDAALAADWDGVDTWFHGDLAAGNLLQRDGALVAVIDFGTCGVGDPACDEAVAWTLLTPEARELFRARLSSDDARWSRGRGWALWKRLKSCAASLGDDSPEAREDRRVLDVILAG